MSTYRPTGPNGQNGDRSRVSSVYTDSVYTRPSTGGSGRSSSRPTYMNYSPSPSGRNESPSSQTSHSTAALPIRAPPPPIQIPQPPNRAAPVPSVQAEAQNGVLLLAISGQPDADLKTYVKTVLAKVSGIKEVVMLATQQYEEVLKQLKMEIYGLAGSLQMELGVHLIFQQDWSGLAVRQSLEEVLGSARKASGTGTVGSAAAKLNGNGAEKKAVSKALRAVICDLKIAPPDEADVLELETSDLEAQWRLSVGLVHAVAQSTVPHLRVSAVQQPAVAEAAQSLRCPFFITTIPSVGKPSRLSLHETSVRALLDNLSQSSSRHGVLMGFADQLLLPDPEPAPAPQTSNTIVAPTGGWNDTDTGDFSAGESPTKLWGLWAQQDMLG